MSIPQYPQRACPNCGQALTRTAILCPYCGIAVTDVPVSAPPVFAAEKIAEKKGRRGRLWLGWIAANVAAGLLIGLNQWLLSRGGANSGLFIASDFILVPIVMGILSAYFWKDLNLGIGQYFLYSCANSILGLAISAVLMGEGVICLLIVSPILIVMIFSGSMLGRWLFHFNDNRLNFSLISLLLALLICDVYSPHHFRNHVSDRILVHASPLVVWSHLARVSPISEKPTFWLFRIGLPYPTQSTAEGAFVGARRECIFTKNAVFDERIVTAQPGRNLTFDVVHQPDDPEILGHAAVERGQFLLQDNGDGTTTLIGTSWYQLHVYPAWYYDIWAQSIARAVHLRVMNHIKTECEAGHGHL